MDDAESRYSDIIDMPHHVSAKRPHMSLYDRAAQFAPFAALTGYDAQIEEAARFTGQKAVLDEAQKDAIDFQLGRLKALISSAVSAEELPRASVTYFSADRKKSGGEYLTVSGRVQKIDSFKRTLIMEDGAQIPVDEIYEISPQTGISEDIYG